MRQRRTSIKADAKFPALRDDPSDPILFVGLKPEVRLRRIEGYEPIAQSRRKGGKPKDFFAMASLCTFMRVCEEP